jgi:phosphoglucomutase
MTVDKDGKIRMDCSSPYAMASLIELKDKYDIAFGNDTDFDRHGIVTKIRFDEPEPLSLGGNQLFVPEPAGLE